MRSAAGHYRSAGGVSANAVLNAVRLAEHDPNPAVIDSERIRADLRHRGREALPHRRTTGHQLDHASRIDGDAGSVHRAEPTLLDKHGDTGADQLARRAPSP